MSRRITTVLALALLTASAAHADGPVSGDALNNAAGTFVESFLQSGCDLCSKAPLGPNWR